MARQKDEHINGGNTGTNNPGAPGGSARRGFFTSAIPSTMESEYYKKCLSASLLPSELLSMIPSSTATEARMRQGESEPWFDDIQGEIEKRMHPTFNYNGVPIVSSPYLVEHITTTKRWRRRGRPCSQPKIRTRTKTMPSRSYYQIGKTFYMHPKRLNQIRRALTTNSG